MKAGKRNRRAEDEEYDSYVQKRCHRFTRWHRKAYSAAERRKTNSFTVLCLNLCESLRELPFIGLAPVYNRFEPAILKPFPHICFRSHEKYIFGITMSHALDNWTPPVLEKPDYFDTVKFIYKHIEFHISEDEAYTV